MAQVTLSPSDLVVLQLVDKSQAYSQSQGKITAIWKQILEKYNRRVSTHIQKSILLIKKFENIVGRCRGKQTFISPQYRALVKRSIGQFDEVHLISNINNGYSISLDILMPLIYKYKPLLNGYGYGKTSWSVILSQYNKATEQNIKDYRTLKKRIPKGFKYQDTRYVSKSSKNKSEIYNDNETTVEKPTHRKPPDSLNILLKIVYKIKPYQIIATARTIVWARITREYDSVLKSSKRAPVKLRDRFDSIVSSFMRGQKVTNEAVNLDLLTKISTEYKLSEQQRDNDATSLLLKLIDKFKPHILQYGGITHKWKDVFDEYNSIMGTSLSKPSSMERRFSLIVKAYNENTNIFYLQCDNLELLSKIMKQYNDIKTNFPEGWFNCMLSLIEDYQQSNNIEKGDDIMWNQILKGYNATLSSEIDDPFILQVNFESVTKMYMENTGEFFEGEDIRLLNKVINKYKIPKTQVSNPTDTLLQLVDNYKPFLIPISSGCRGETWERVFQEYSAIWKSHYASYLSLQNSFKRIVDRYLYENYDSGCTDVELLDRISTDFALGKSKQYKSILDKRERKEKANQVDKYDANHVYDPSFQNLSKPQSETDNKNTIENSSFLVSKLSNTNASNLRVPDTTRKEYNLYSLLKIVHKFKPYLYISSARTGTWKKITSDYNYLNNSQKMYTDIRDEFDRLFIEFYYAKTPVHNQANLEILNKISAEFEKSNQRKENKETFCFLKLIDKYKPHINLIDKDIIKWKPVLDEYNSILSLNILSIGTQKRRFQTLINAYNENSNTYYLGCDDPSLLVKIVKEYNHLSSNFPKGWLDCLLTLVDDYNLFNKTRDIQTHVWKEILNAYNLTLNANIDDQFILQFNLTKTIEAYKDKMTGELFATVENISLLEKVVHGYVGWEARKDKLETKTINELNEQNIYTNNSVDILLELVNKYKPFLIPIESGMRMKTWKLILQRYNDLFGSEHTWYSVVQNKFRRIIDNYVFKNSSSGCSNIKLLDQLAVEFVCERPDLYNSVIGRFEGKKITSNINKENETKTDADSNIAISKPLIASPNIPLPLISTGPLPSTSAETISKPVSRKYRDLHKKNKVTKPRPLNLDFSAFNSGFLILDNTNISLRKIKMSKIKYLLESGDTHYNTVLNQLNELNQNIQKDLINLIHLQEALTTLNNNCKNEFGSSQNIKMFVEKHVKYELKRMVSRLNVSNQELQIINES